MFVARLRCFRCGRPYDAAGLRNLCDCGRPLRVEYDLDGVRGALSRAALGSRSPDLWRYREALPVPKDQPIPSLGEGFTPLIQADRLAHSLGMEAGTLFVKDEALNPTGSFKSRGMAVAVAMAKALGARSLAVPSAGNAGGALAAYAALHGLRATVFMPRDVPACNRLECEILGAQVELVDGLITDCAKALQALAPSEGWFDVSTLKEPYRVEGKKTMGYEIAEQLGWRLPDVIIYPTGGGTGLIGMAKAFDELEALGWISSKRPRMVSVQASGCAPIAAAFDQGLVEALEFENAQTVAAGLRVPRAIGDFVMLEVLRKTSGAALAVEDAELMADARSLSSLTGVCACPEGGACLSALKRLLKKGSIGKRETAVLFNTASGAKYGEAFAAFPGD
jgi:threonine synthase